MYGSTHEISDTLRGNAAACVARGVRYRGLAKNLAKAHLMFALANLYQVRRQLLPAQVPLSTIVRNSPLWIV